MKPEFNMRVIYLLLVFLFPNSLFSQSSWKWPMNDSLAMDFATFPPTSFNNYMTGSKGPKGAGQSISLTDCNGDLMMYAKGQWIWGKGVITELNQNLLFRSACIIPTLGNVEDSMCYYLIGIQSNSVDYHLTTFDACFNDSNKVIAFGHRKQIGQNPNTNWKSWYAQTYHQNDDGTYWIITTDQLDEIRCYKVSPAGIDSNAVVSKTGIKYAYRLGMVFYEQRGGIAVNHAGNKIVLTGVPNHSGNTYSAYVLDFDSKTGKVDASSLKGILTFKPDPKFKYETNYCTYQAVFAPCDSLLYISAGPDWQYTDYWKIKDRTQFNYIFQVNMNSGAVTPVVEKYQYHKENTNWSDFYSGMQMAPDGRIYVLYHGKDKYYASDLSVIHHPNRPYPFCHFEDKLGLPILIRTLPHSREKPLQLELVSPQERDHCVKEASIHLMIDSQFTTAVLHFGNGDSSVFYPQGKMLDTTLTHKYIRNGTYGLQLRGHASCGPDLVYLDTISVYRPPESLALELSIARDCDSVSLLLSDTVAHAAHAEVLWKGVKEKTGIDTATQQPQFVRFASTYRSDTSIRIRYTLSNQYCTVQKDSMVELKRYPTPVLDIAPKQASTKWNADSVYLCHKQAFTLLDSSPNLSNLLINWGDGAESSYTDSALRRAGLSHMYSNHGLYNVTATGVNPYGCRDTNLFWVRQLPRSAFVFTPDSTQPCGSQNFFGFDVSISAHSNDNDPPVSLWVNEDSIGVFAREFHTQNLPPGTNEFRLKSVTQLGCTALDTLAVVVFPNPTVKITVTDSNLCSGQAFVLVQNQSTGYFAPNSCRLVLNQNAPVSLNVHETTNLTELDSGTNRLFLSVIDTNGCRDSTRHDFMVHPTPKVEFIDFKRTWCFNEQPVIIQTSALPEHHYQWNIQPSLNASRIEKTFDNTGIHPLQLIVTSPRNCSDTLLEQIEITEQYTLYLHTRPGCEDQLASLNLTVSPGGHPLESITWRHNGFIIQGENSSALNRNFSVGEHLIQIITSDGYGCKSSVEKTVNIYPSVQANFNVQRIDANAKEVEFLLKDLSTNALWNYWLLEDGRRFDNLPSLLASFPAPDTTNIQLVAYNQGCRDTLNKSIPVIALYSVLVPTAFSPNGDGINDNFTVSAPGLRFFTISIYNRWGQLIFKGNEWDGTIDGVKAEAGAYVYHLVGRTFEYKLFEKSGSVILLD